MLTDRSKQQIVRDLQAQVEETWGVERAGALQPQIDETAEALYLVARARFELDAEEPDFLVAPAADQEA